MRSAVLLLCVAGAPACFVPRGEICFPTVLPGEPQGVVVVEQPESQPPAAARGVIPEEQAPVVYATPGPRVETGLFFSDDAAWVRARTRLLYSGYVDTGLLFTDDDFAFHIDAMRIQRASSRTPLSLGVGIGFYGAFTDEFDGDVTALVLSGLASYPFDTDYPTRANVQISFAPDPTTFGDGDSLMDFKVGFEIGIGNFASAEIGFREFEVDLEVGGDYDLTDGPYFGVSIGF